MIKCADLSCAHKRKERNFNIFSREKKKKFKMDKRWLNVYHKMLQNAEKKETQGTQILFMTTLLF